GRYGKDLFLMPLTFREYVEVIDPKWFGKHENDSIEEMRFHNNQLKIYFERFLITGGIPLVINEYETNGEIPNFIFDLYYSWIIGDMLKEGKKEQTLKELMKSILVCYSTPVSWDSLAKRSSIKSHVTIASYIEILSNIFVVLDCYFYDIHQKKVNFNKNKKIYLFDPFILQVFSERLNIYVDREKMIEGIVGAKIKHEDVPGDIYFTKIKKETDFVRSSGSGIEVKYQNTLSKEDFTNRRYFNDFKVLSRDIFDRDTLPVHVYLFVENI
ncbi:MAG: hypothetical protein U9R75_01225, partial [Candidatus Thermoplasmatota archaeon]|nr:hypothetical protein [Candidatus Thermoplasmatota archaeon]